MTHLDDPSFKDYLENAILTCESDIPVFCHACQGSLSKLALTSSWSKIFNILLTKEIEGTIILDIDEMPDLNTTIADLLSY